MGANVRSKVGFSLLDPSLTWKDIQWIRTFTALPVVVKGVLTGLIFYCIFLAGNTTGGATVPEVFAKLI